MYNTFSGLRPRRYVIAAAVVIVVLLVVFAISAWQKANTRAVLRSTPVSLAEILPTSTSSPTPVPPTATPTPEPCPTDVNEWTLFDILPNSHLRAISPSCVYDGLYQTARWKLLTYRGYAGPEAASVLGLPGMPVGPTIESIGGITSMGESQQILLTHGIYRDDYAFWLVDKTGKPAGIEYSLRGCFRPFDVVGGDVEDWGSGYDVICLLALDRNAGWGVHNANGAVYALEVPAVRQFHLFGYAEGQWSLIGTFKGMTSTIDDIAAFEQDRNDFNLRTGWNPTAADVSRFEMHPLPHDWQAHNDPSVLQEFFQSVGEGQ